MPAKIPHPPQFSKRFLSPKEKLLQRPLSPLNCKVKSQHRGLVLHLGVGFAAYEVQAKRLTIIVQQKFHAAIFGEEVCSSLKCTRIAAVFGTEPNLYL
jgi:hypothetical protein